MYLLLRQSALKLILLEGVLYDILHVLASVLHSAHEVEQGVVTQLEGTQQRRRLASHNLPAPHSRRSLESSSLKFICKPYPDIIHDRKGGGGVFPAQGAGGESIKQSPGSK